MKTLILVTHPNLEKSIINKRWVAELKKYPEQLGCWVFALDKIKKSPASHNRPAGSIFLAGLDYSFPAFMRFIRSSIACL